MLKTFAKFATMNGLLWMLVSVILIMNHYYFFFSWDFFCRSFVWRIKRRFLANFQLKIQAWFVLHLNILRLLFLMLNDFRAARSFSQVGVKRIFLWHNDYIGTHLATHYHSVSLYSSFNCHCRFSHCFVSTLRNVWLCWSVFIIASMAAIVSQKLHSGFPFICLFLTYASIHHNYR